MDRCQEYDNFATCMVENPAVSGTLAGSDPITVAANADLAPACGLLAARTSFINSSGSTVVICLAEATVKVEPAVNSVEVNADVAPIFGDDDALTIETTSGDVFTLTNSSAKLPR